MINRYITIAFFSAMMLFQVHTAWGDSVWDSPLTPDKDTPIKSVEELKRITDISGLKGPGPRDLICPHCKKLKKEYEDAYDRAEKEARRMPDRFRSSEKLEKAVQERLGPDFPTSTPHFTHANLRAFYDKLIKLEEAKKRFDNCEDTCSSNLTAYSVYGHIMKRIKPKCTDCDEAADKVNSVIDQIARFQNQLHEIKKLKIKAKKKKSSPKQLDYLKEQVEKKLTKAHDDYRAALKAYFQCVEDFCKKPIGGSTNNGESSQQSQAPRPAATGLSPLNPNEFVNGLSAGVLISYDSSKRDGQIENQAFDTINGSNTKRGFGASLLMQYYFMSNPSWFFFSSAAYPGDRTSQLVKGLTDPFSEVESQLTITKKWIINTGVGKNLFTVGNCSKEQVIRCIHVALGVGLAAIHQTYEGTIGELGKTDIMQSNTIISPVGMVEGVIPVGSHLGLLVGVMLNSLPQYSFQADSPLDNRHVFSNRSAMEYQVNLGLKYFFNSIEDR